MNWSRAKDILIIALFIANILLFRNYLTGIRAEEAHIAQSTAAAIDYAEASGIKINCEVPQKILKLPVISVSIKGGNSAGGLTRILLKEAPLEIIGLRSAFYVEQIDETDKSISILPAYTALLKSMDSVEEQIDEIELIYLVDRAAYAGEAGEDTALPYWKLSSNGNNYYYSAFAE